MRLPRYARNDNIGQSVKKASAMTLLSIAPSAVIPRKGAKLLDVGIPL